MEDGDKYSFAGMFESYLDVSYNDLLYNINKVKDSVNSERVRNYIEKNKLKNGEMAVIKKLLVLVYGLELMLIKAFMNM